MGIKSIALAATMLVLSTNVNAATIIQAVSVISDTPSYSSLDSNNGINQSGLSVGYISGVTDFDTYIASNPTHDNFSNSTAGYELGTVPVEIIFDLGEAYIIESLALWNRGLSNQGVKNFSLYASNDASFTSSTLLGGFIATDVLGTDNETGVEVFSFTQSSARFIRMDVASYYGTALVSFNEVAFEATATVVPIPAAAWLFGSGLIGLVGLARRKANA